MNLLPKEEAEKELAAARERVARASKAQQIATVNFCREKDFAALAEANKKLRLALEWYGECHVSANQDRPRALEVALRENDDAEELLRNVLGEVYAAVKEPEEARNDVVEAIIAITTSRQRIYRVLSEIGERAFTDG